MLINNFNSVIGILLISLSFGAPPIITSNGGGDTDSDSFAENSTSAVTTVTSTDVDAGDTATYSKSGADADNFTINSSTGELTFVSAPDYEIPADTGGDNIYIVDVVVTDSGSLTDTQTLTITVTDVNDNPVVTAGGTLQYTENSNATAIDNTLAISDQDDVQLSGATATISNNFIIGDILDLSTQNGISGTYDSSTGVLTISGVAFLSEYETALQSITYHSTSEDPTITASSRTITWEVTDVDSGGFGAESSSGVVSTINITPTIDTPVVTAGATLSYTEDDPSENHRAVIDDTLTISDFDDTQLDGATVTISSGFTTDDILALTTQNGISGTYDSSTGVLTIIGTASNGNYQAALRYITYHSTSEDPTITSNSRTITWEVTDANSDGAGVGISSSVTSTITIIATNDKPVININNL